MSCGSENQDFIGTALSAGGIEGSENHSKHQLHFCIHVERMHTKEYTHTYIRNIKEQVGFLVDKMSAALTAGVSLSQQVCVTVPYRMKSSISVCMYVYVVPHTYYYY